MTSQQEAAQQAIQAFQGHRQQFEDEPPIRMPDEVSVLSHVGQPEPSSLQKRQSVGIGRVGTYIYDTELSKTHSNKRIVFPTFASHWAVMVFEETSTEYGHGYHLTFHEPAAAELSPAADTSRAILFSPMFLDSAPQGIKWIGTTRYSHNDRMKIGQKMIQAFGSYHRVFWNCQHFARLYLKVITEGEGAFEEWTFSQASNLFLCAFVVTTPVALTNLTIEVQKANALLDKFARIGEDTNNSNNSDHERFILEASDEAITLAQKLAVEDYARDHPNERKVEKRAPLRDMLARLKESVKGYKWISR